MSFSRESKDRFSNFKKIWICLNIPHICVTANQKKKLNFKLNFSNFQILTNKILFFVSYPEFSKFITHFKIIRVLKCSVVASESEK